MSVHNHPPYRPVCNERRVNGQLRGACLTDEGDPVSESPTILVLNDRTRFGGETGAGLMRNRCAFTSKDMGADWDAAFTYAIVFGWSDDGPLGDMADRWGWDDELVWFLREAHGRFAALADRVEETP